MGRYWTLGGAADALLKIEGSKFIAEAHPVFSEVEAEERLEAARKNYFDATHHCYAYAIGEERTLFRYSDDGEPSGTAGVKIYSTLQEGNLSDLIIIVTRYFGGTKLGVGGLGRAYHDAAEAVLTQARRVVREPVQRITAVVDYTYITPLLSLVHRLDAFIEATEYAANVTVMILVPHAAADTLERQLTDMTHGTVVLTRGAWTIRSVE